MQGAIELIPDDLIELVIAHLFPNVNPDTDDDRRRLFISSAQ